MAVGEERRKEPEPRARARRLDVDVDVGARDRVAHLGDRVARVVEGVDLQHRLDEVHEGRPREVGETPRGPDALEQGAAGIEPQRVLREHHRLGSPHLGPADHHLEVGPDAVLRGLSRDRDDLERDVGVPSPQRGHGGCRDEPREAVGGRQAHESAEFRARARAPEGRDRRLDRLGGPDDALAERGQRPPVGSSSEHAPAERAFERLDPARHRGVVDAEAASRGREAARAGDLEQHEEVVGARCDFSRIHVCNFV